MILLNRLLFFLFFILVTTYCKSQDLFNEANVLKFANFLYSTHQYKFASEEYERLILLTPEKFDYKISLIHSYRLGENYKEAERRIVDFSDDSLKFLKGPLATEFLKVKLLQEHFDEAQQYLKQDDHLESVTKNAYLEYLFLLRKNWKLADSVNRQFHVLDNRYDQLLSDAGKIRLKSPALSCALSVVVPGLGKVYSGYWQDGAIAFIFVGVNAWQSYRGFAKYGVGNATGWICGSFGLGFYLGNIYGAIKAAKRHNKTANEKIYNRAKSYIYSDFQ